MIHCISNVGSYVCFFFETKRTAFKQAVHFSDSLYFQCLNSGIAFSIPKKMHHFLENKAFQPISEEKSRAYRIEGLSKRMCTGSELWMLDWSPFAALVGSFFLCYGN